MGEGVFSSFSLEITMDKEYKDFINSGTVTGRSDSTKCNISAISKNEVYKDMKGNTVLIVGSGRRSDAHERFQEHVKQMQKDMEKSMIVMCDEVSNAYEAFHVLSKAFKKMPILCPEDMSFDLNIDFSSLESIVIDSMTTVGCSEFLYNEAGIIDKKTWKKLAKKQKRLENKPQKEYWANKWNHKIKRKL